MKISRQDLLALRAAIETRFSAADRVAIWSRYVARQLSAERFRWDMLRASGFDTAPLYRAGLNDNDISTALRHIIRVKTAADSKTRADPRARRR
jgi:hypothetical protein